MDVGFKGYCQYCGKPCYRGDEFAKSGKGKTAHIVYFHKRCFEIECRTNKEAKDAK